MNAAAAALVETPRPGLPPMTKVVRVGVLSRLTKLDPREAVDYVSATILSQIFDTPYAATTGESGVRPLLFERLRSENAYSSEYSAAVQPGIFFSDGTPLTAEIAARSLRVTPVLRNKATVELRGDRVWFSLKFPNARFELTLAQSGCALVLDKALSLLGTGPFMFASRPNLRMLQSAPSIDLVRNPHSRGRSAADEVRFCVHPATGDGLPQTLVNALRDGSVDVTTALSTADLSTYQISGVTATMQPANSTAMLFFNTERALASRELRRGIAAAIDIHEVAGVAHTRNPTAFVAASVLPPSMGRTLGVPSFDRAAAARHIESAGAVGTQLTMLVPGGPRPYLPRPLQVAQNIQAQLAKVGITVRLVEARTSDELFDMLYKGAFDLALAGWIADTPDPADFFEALLWSEAVGGQNLCNYARWKNPTTDIALGRFRSAPTDAHRQALDRLIRDEAPFLPLMYGQSTAIHSRKLRNVAISPIGLLPIADVTL